MLKPPVAAGPLKVTVPYDLAPPITDAGERVKLARVGGAIVRVDV
jgi:hypothetical protein